MNVLTPGQKDTLDRRLVELKRLRSRHVRPERPKSRSGPRDCQCSDFPDRNLLQRSSQTNIEPSTWGKIKNLFE